MGRDFLYFIPTGETLDGRALYRRENIAKVESYGAELDVKFDLSKDLRPFPTTPSRRP